MPEFDPDKFLKTFAAAKIAAYVVRSTDPVKQKMIDRLRSLTDMAMDIVQDLVEGGSLKE